MSTLLGGFGFRLISALGIFKKSQKFFDVSDFLRLHKKCGTIGCVVIIIKENNINLFLIFGNQLFSFI